MLPTASYLKNGEFGENPPGGGRIRTISGVKAPEKRKKPCAILVWKTYSTYYEVMESMRRGCDVSSLAHGGGDSAAILCVRLCAGCDVRAVRGAAAAANFEVRKIGGFQQVSMRYLLWDRGYTKSHNDMLPTADMCYRRVTGYTRS